MPMVEDVEPYACIWNDVDEIEYYSILHILVYYVPDYSVPLTKIENYLYLHFYIYIKITFN